MKRVKTEKEATQETSVNTEPLGIKEMLGKRETPDLQEQLDPQELEALQERTGLKDTLALLDSLETQDPLESQAQTVLMVDRDQREIMERLGKLDHQGLLGNLVLQGHQDGGDMSVLKEKKGNRGRRDQRVLPEQRVYLERQGPWDPRDNLEIPVQRGCAASQGLQENRV